MYFTTVWFVLKFSNNSSNIFRFVITLFLLCSQTYISYAKVICHWIVMISLQISRIEIFHKRNLFFGMIIQKRSNKDIIVKFKVAFLLLKFSSFRQIQVTIHNKKSPNEIIHLSFLGGCMKTKCNKWMKFRTSKKFHLSCCCKETQFIFTRKWFPFARDNFNLLEGINY